jgi:histidine triad (HIT) family protein
MEDCIFCKIIRGEIPSERVLEDDSTIAIKDIDPKAPVHLLVIPRQHVRSLDDIHEFTPQQTQDLLQFVVRAAEVAGVRESGYRVMANIGRDAGQAVDHLHLHILGGTRLADLV